MKYNPLNRKMISACMILLALVAGVTPSKSQITTSYAVARPTPGIFYLKIGGLAGPAKGYLNKGIECHGFNTVALPDRLKAGTYYIQFVDANGYAYAGMTGSTVTITSKPKDAAAAVVSGKRMHEPMRIVKEIDKSTPLNFTIAPEDVDGDGTLDIVMSIQHPGMPPNAPAPQKN